MPTVGFDAKTTIGQLAAALAFVRDLVRWHRGELQEFSFDNFIERAEQMTDHTKREGE